MNQILIKDGQISLNPDYMVDVIGKIAINIEEQKDRAIIANLPTDSLEKLKESIEKELIIRINEKR